MSARLSGERNCPLCGLDFDVRDAACNHGCPLGSFCRLVRCPGCGYEFSDGPRRASWFGRVFRRREPQAEAPDELCGLRTLGELGLGQGGEVVLVDGKEPRKRSTLAVYGLVPGASVTLLQRQPACVVQVGETELALEGEIAEKILVKPSIAD